MSSPCCKCSEESVKTVDGEFYCQEHYDELFVICNCCGKDTSIDNYTNVNDECICDKCLDNYYSKCACCDEYYHTDNEWYEVAGGDYVCEYCLDNYYKKCKKCDDSYLKDSLVSDTCYGCRKTMIECKCGEFHEPHSMCICTPDYILKTIEL